MPLPTTLSADLIADLDRRCADFAAGWKADGAARLEALLAGVPTEARPELFRRLAAIEQEQRQRLGRPLLPAEGRERFAGLGPWASAALRDLGLDEDAPSLSLDIIAGPFAGRSFRLAGQAAFVVGRGPAGVHLPLEGDPAVSRLHFVVEFAPPTARVADLSSRNGTFVNGMKVTEADLADGDEVRAGKTALKVRLWPGRAAPPAVRPPPSIPGYALEGEIGRGGMGVVHRARRLADGAAAAVKMVSPAVDLEPEVVGRFRREIAILGRLRHPNIVQLLDSGAAGGVLYFVMELVEGESAADLVRRAGPLPPGRVAAIGRQLLDALAHAHALGFVHRDVKPSNVLLTASGEVKLADFGLARAYQASALSGLTAAGSPGGTPEFMPPEQVLDFRSARPAADLYATAATLYALLEGRPIYEPAPSTLGLLWRIMTSEPIPLRPPPLSGPLGEVIRRGLAREPAQRYPDAAAMRDALPRGV